MKSESRERYSIILLYDKESQSRITETKKFLRTNGINYKKFYDDLNHITISAFDNENEQDLLKLVKDFSETRKSFSVVLESIGAFVLGNNVLFYSPTANSELVQAHKDFYTFTTDNCKKFDANYLPDNLVFHSTLATRLTDSELTKAFDLVKSENILPLTCIVEKVCILQTNPKPTKVVETLYFGK